MDGRLLSSGGSLFRELDRGIGETLKFSNVGTALSDDAPHLRGWRKDLHRQADVHAASKALFPELLVDQVLGLKNNEFINESLYFDLYYTVISTYLYFDIRGLTICYILINVLICYLPLRFRRAEDGDFPFIAGRRLRDDWHGGFTTTGCWVGGFISGRGNLK